MTRGSGGTLLGLFAVVMLVACQTGFGAYERYRNPALGFALDAPRAAVVQAEGSSRVKFKVVGADSRPASEITDGFTLTVYRDTAADAPDLSSYADAVLQRLRGRDRSITDEVRMTRVSGDRAVRFAYRSALGNEVSQYLFMPESGGHYRVSYSIGGDARGGYLSQVERMLSSLRFFPPGAE